MPILTLAAKDLRLLLRDPRSAVILLVTPLLLILVLGLALGEGFGESPDERLRISIVNLDRGLPEHATFPDKPWADVVIDDLSTTENIRLEIIPDLATAERLIARGRRPAIIVFEPDFSERMQRCSFLTNANPPPINPLGARRRPDRTTRRQVARGQNAAGLRVDHRTGDAGHAPARGHSVDDRQGVSA